MSEKLYQLMEKMYIEMQTRFTKIEETMATKEELRAIEEKMATKDELRAIEEKMATKEEMRSLEMATKYDMIRLENKMDENFGALFDGHTLLNEKIDRLESKVDRIEQKVEIHDFEIKVVKKAVE